MESLGNVESLNNTKDCSPATIHGNATSMLRWLFTHVNCASGTEAPGSSGTPPTPGTSGVRKIAVTELQSLMKMADDPKELAERDRCFIPK